MAEANHGRRACLPVWVTGLHAGRAGHGGAGGAASERGGDYKILMCATQYI
jgi:hypothetical protein